jgi:hypothetical protein
MPKIIASMRFSLNDTETGTIKILFFVDFDAEFRFYFILINMNFEFSLYRIRPLSFQFLYLFVLFYPDKIATFLVEIKSLHLFKWGLVFYGIENGN